MSVMEPSSYLQVGMMPVEVIEVTLKIGLVQSANHSQVQYKIVNPETKELLAFRSWPHATRSDWLGVLAVVLICLAEDVDVLVNPDPF